MPTPVPPSPQVNLFDEPELSTSLRPAALDAGTTALAGRLHARWGERWHLGTSSWHFPGWQGLVWGAPYPEARLSRDGLGAYAQHPLLRTVSLDRAFYRPLDSASYGRLGAQAGAGFRFVVKAVSAVTDATLRQAGSGGRLQANPAFLDPALALAQCVAPAAAGLGEKLGVLVFQLSPLPTRWLHDLPALHARLADLFAAVVPALPVGSLAALEVRDAALLTPELAALLKRHGVRYCLGLHDRMPALDAQLPMLRATWPGDLVCRWNLQRGLRYADAKDLFAPFDRLQAPDPGTRNALARVAAATLDAGHRVFVTINNKAEGSAPLSVLALAGALDAITAPP